MNLNHNHQKNTDFLAYTPFGLFDFFYMLSLSITLICAAFFSLGIPRSKYVIWQEKIIPRIHLRSLTTVMTSLGIKSQSRQSNLKLG